jgi:hypothetical protein
MKSETPWCKRVTTSATRLITRNKIKIALLSVKAVGDILFRSIRQTLPYWSSPAKVLFGTNLIRNYTLKVKLLYSFGPFNCYVNV